MKPTIVNINLPTSWAELDDGQLYYVYGLLASNLSGTQIKTCCLFMWGRLKVVCRFGDGYLIRRGRMECYVTAEVIHGAIKSLDYLEDIPPVPVRIRQLKGHSAIDAHMRGVAFERYLFIENLYQGYLHSQRQLLLNEMGEFLYDAERLELNQAEKMNVFYWWTTLKSFLSRQFPHFFVPSSGGNDDLLGHDKPLSRQLQESMDAQIRALTKGDITKEKEILAMDTWRALTELDALAREAEEINRKYGKS